MNILHNFAQDIQAVIGYKSDIWAMGIVLHQWMYDGVSPYAHVAGVQLGGSNSYGGQMHRKPLLAAGLPAPDQAAVLQMLQLNRRLELIWLTTAAAVAFITKTLS